MIDERGPVRLETLDDGALWRVVLATPEGNILDEEKCERLSAILVRARDARNLKAILIEGEGPNFSYGVSVEEHLPDRFQAMLRNFHRVFHKMLAASVVTLAAVRGRCLGGGLELASSCNRVFAAPDSKLGQPEIVLGVFAPVASVLLAERIGRGPAEDLLLSGRSIGSEEAARIGLVDEIADDPGRAALEYARTHLLVRSASSLRLACRAARSGYAERFRAGLARVERLYAGELMSTADAGEGLRAFLEKRSPNWKNE